MVHFSVNLRPSLVYSIVLIFLLFDAFSYAAKVVEIDAICRETKNPSFCSDILNSKPGGASGADLVTLGQYTIDVVRANVTNTINLIKSLIANSSDPNAKDHYKMCLAHFGNEEGALGDIENTESLLKKRDYQGMNGAASAVITDVDDCVSGESPSDPPYKDPSLLPQYADVIEKVVEIIIVISNYLVQK